MSVPPILLIHCRTGCIQAGLTGDGSPRHQSVFRLGPCRLRTRQGPSIDVSRTRQLHSSCKPCFLYFVPLHISLQVAARDAALPLFHVTLVLISWQNRFTVLALLSLHRVYVNLTNVFAYL